MFVLLVTAFYITWLCIIDHYDTSSESIILRFEVCHRSHDRSIREEVVNRLQLDTYSSVHH